MLILDELLDGLRAACAAFPDKRKGGGVYSMADIGVSAFSLFFMQSESFLPISVRSKKDARPPIAILCSAWRKFRPTITSGLCSTRFILRICNPRSIKWLRRCGRRAA